jgi:hypothetical protein
MFRIMRDLYLPRRTLARASQPDRKSPAPNSGSPAAELLEKKRREAKADRTLEKMEWLPSLARPAIGPRPVAEITAPEILSVLRGVEGDDMKPQRAYGR